MGLKVATVVVALCAAVTHAWLNEYDQPVHFECPDGQFLSHVTSEHDNHMEDRVWDMGCVAVPVEGTPTNCQWTNYVNEFDRPLAFQCPGEGYMTGMASVHDNRHEDRRFQFKCCEMPGSLVHGCAFTGWENELDHPLDYRVPSGKIMRGWESVHDNHKEDRQFKFEICDINLQ